MNPSGPESGSDRVIRGGGWLHDAVYCRSSFRPRAGPRFRDDFLGFRLARDGAWPSYFFTLGGAKTDERPRRIEGIQSATRRVFTPFQVFQDQFENGERSPEVVYLPDGTFTMGDLQGHGHSNEKPVHEVRLSAFAIGRYPITVVEYLRFVDATGSHYPEWLETGNKYHLETGTDKHYRQAGVSLDNREHPVVGITWENAAAYCQWLSEQTGEQYRLPTEAQWEYACRAGSGAEYCFGSDAGQLGDYAWYRKNAEGRLHDVGQKQPNAWGLYDMHGNVWEWVEDWYDVYSDDAQVDPSGPESGSSRVFRGGGWRDVAEDCRSSIRDHGGPRYRDFDLGFRLARTV